MGTKKEKALSKEGLLELELVFDIDKNLLDDEWLRQPKLYFEWAVQLEDARAEFEETKAEFDVTKSEVDLAIRMSPGDYEDLPKEVVEKGKITEKMVAAILITQTEYKDAQQAMFTARHRVGILQAVVTALDHRKKALEKLVDLYGQKYFATPRASENSKEAMEEVEKNSVRRRGKGMSIEEANEILAKERAKGKKRRNRDNS